MFRAQAWIPYRPDSLAVVRFGLALASAARSGSGSGSASGSGPGAGVAVVLQQVLAGVVSRYLFSVTVRDPPSFFLHPYCILGDLT